MNVSNPILPANLDDGVVNALPDTIKGGIYYGFVLFYAHLFHRLPCSCAVSSGMFPPDFNSSAFTLTLICFDLLWFNTHC